MATEFLIAPNISPATLVRLERIPRGWHQINLAEKTQITKAEVSTLKQGIHIIPVVCHRRLVALNLAGEESMV